MKTDDLIQIFDSSDIQELDRLCKENGLTLADIQRQDDHGKIIETGEETVAVYAWKPVVENSANSFTGIFFHKWRGGGRINLLEMQLNWETYNRFMIELVSNKAFKKSYLRRKDGKDRRFMHVTNKIYFRFIHRQMIHPLIPYSENYCVIVMRHYTYTK